MILALYGVMNNRIAHFPGHINSVIKIIHSIQENKNALYELTKFANFLVPNHPMTNQPCPFTTSYRLIPLPHNHYPSLRPSLPHSLY